MSDFKAALQAVTNVPPERQTLMGKGLWIGTLKDDKDISGLTPKVGQVITLMGSADVLKEVPKDVCEGNGNLQWQCLTRNNVRVLEHL